MQRDPIIIVGAGWAGLSAAVTLTRAGHKVIVLEASPQAGGRARGVDFGGSIVDNGQHLLMGAYQQTLTLLKWLEVTEASAFLRMPLELRMMGAINPISNPANPENLFHLRLPNVLSPLHLIIGLTAAKGLTLKDRLKAIQFCRQMQTLQFKLPKDISVLALLQQYRQSKRLIETLWGPIALAALSTPIEQASANVFLQILQKIITARSQHSHWLFPKADLSTLLPYPTEHYLKSHGNPVFYHQRVQELIITDGQIKGVRTGSQTFKGQTVILATPPSVTAKLLEPHSPNYSACQSLISQLLAFNYQPITTVYLRYADPIQLPSPMIGLINQTGHWVFDRTTANQNDIVSIVITGTGPHSEMDHDSLIKKISQELKTIFKTSKTFAKAPIDARVITEKRAAFSCEVGIEDRRPAQETPFLNLWLAGDYTQIGYPATLEGAVQSGMKVAKLILYRDICLI